MFFFDTTRTTRKVETDIPESEWVARAKRGDEGAFVHLATIYRPRIWSTASRFARSRVELEDLTQDLFLTKREAGGKLVMRATGIVPYHQSSFEEREVALDPKLFRAT